MLSEDRVSSGGWMNQKGRGGGGGVSHRSEVHYQGQLEVQYAGDGENQKPRKIKN